MRFAALSVLAGALVVATSADEVPCCEDIDPPVSDERDCVHHRKVKAGVRMEKANADAVGSFAVVKDCEHDGDCFRKQRCDDGAACFVYEPCKYRDDCVEEVDCYRKCVVREAVAKGFRFEQHSNPVGFYYDKCAHNEKCARKIPCHGTMLDSKECGDLRECDTAVGHENCYVEKDCPVPCDDDDEPPCECYRHEKVNVGHRVVTANDGNTVDHRPFLKKECPAEVAGCFVKVDCDPTKGDLDCLSYEDCKSDDGSCVMELDCFGECVRREWGTTGFWFDMNNSQSGFRYEKCGFDDECEEKIPCHLAGTDSSGCGELRPCLDDKDDTGNKMKCFEELKCPYPCNPTAAPSSKPTKDNEPDKSKEPSPARSPKPSKDDNSDKSEEPSPASSPKPSKVAGGSGPSDCRCLRHRKVPKGFKMTKATPNSLVRFTQETCPDDDKCFVKGECDNDDPTSPCLTYEKCEDGDCVVEMDCFGKCVRKELTVVGFTFVSTDDDPLRFYYDKCPHNVKDCLLKIPCDDASTDKKCGVLKPCGPNTPSIKCFQETECPRPCDPTPAPSSKPSGENDEPSDCRCYRHEPAENGWTVEKAMPNSLIKFRKELCPEGKDCFLKKECDSTLDKCLTYRRCINSKCVREVECSGCVRKEHVEYGSMFTPIDDGFGFFYDACPSDADCLLKVPCTASVDKKCGELKDCTPQTVTPTGEKCFRESRCSGDCDPTPSPTVSPAPSQGCECYRREKAKYGFKEVKVGPNTKDNFIKKECPAYPDECYKKEKCDPATDPIEKCLTYRQCEGDDCFREVNCNRCVRHVKSEEGFKLVPATSMRGFIYKDCPHDKDCLEKTPCSGFSDQECMMWEKCSVFDNDKICFKEEPCPLPCDPTPSPSLPLAPTPAPIFQNDPDECECYRHDKSPNGVGFRIVGANPNTPGSFVMSECPDGEECFRKEVCASFNDDCVVYEKCEGDDCVDEVNCFGKCVIRETTKEGFMFEPTPGRGFYYASCEHNADCLQKMPCNDEMVDKCGTLVKCDPTTSFTMCFTEYRCPSPCPPSSSPTSAPTPLCRLGGKLTRMFNKLL